MKIDCKEISINSDDIGCQVSFSENEFLGTEIETMTDEEILESSGNYLLIQRSFPEDDFEDDYFYYETHDENHCGELADFNIYLNRQQFELKFITDSIVVFIKPTDEEYKNLKKVLPLFATEVNKVFIDD